MQALNVPSAPRCLVMGSAWIARVTDEPSRD